MGCLSWLVAADFNEILHLNKKSGGVCRNFTAMSAFGEVMDDCGLLDMGFRGYKFMWSNRQFRWELIQERLDRTLCCLNWRSLFPDAIVVHKDYPSSDHRVLVVDGVSKQSVDRYQGGRGSFHFHFEHAWADDLDCKRIVQNY
ncbi:hypothetical protein ACOSP7_018904 [Xanthoceras sorbifolium]